MSPIILISSGPASRPDPSIQLFLDIDNVLNRTSTTAVIPDHPRNPTGLDPELCRLLFDIVEATNCSIVITSAWRTDELAMRHLLDKLAPVGEHIIGWTPVIPSEEFTTNNVREQEILAHIHACHGLRQFAVLDDCPWTYRRFAANAFITEERFGLTPATRDLIIAHLLSAPAAERLVVPLHTPFGMLELTFPQGDLPHFSIGTVWGAVDIHTTQGVCAIYEFSNSRPGNGDVDRSLRALAHVCPHLEVVDAGMPGEDTLTFWLKKLNAGKLHAVREDNGTVHTRCTGRALGVTSRKFKHQRLAFPS